MSQQPHIGDPGFSRDPDLEKLRQTDRPATAHIEATAESAAQQPVIHFAPDPTGEGRDRAEELSQARANQN